MSVEWSHVLYLLLNTLIYRWLREDDKMKIRIGIFKKYFYYVNKIFINNKYFL